MKGKLLIDSKNICFISPITGNGFCGSHWWAIKAFFRLLPCLVWTGSRIERYLSKESV